MQQVVENLAKQPLACVILSVLLFMFGFVRNYALLDSLLRMHRSKSAVQKLKREYTLLQRLCLRHFKGNCRHAIKFCNGMIIFQKVGWVCFAVYLLVSLLAAFGLFHATFAVWFAIGLAAVFDVPSCAINQILVRPVIFGRRKKFSFEKYHNTGDHDSLL